MRTPMMIGARSTSVPPNNARRAISGRSEVLDDSDADATLIRAVRSGDLVAFGALYERHVAAVRQLASRLCANSGDVDDVVSEVFANTLRALKSGHGPDAELHSYVLTTTRHTVIKFATRADSRHAVAVDDNDLDLAVDSDVLLAGPTGHAFVHLPDRFQNVLWLTCVEGLSTAEVGARTDLDHSAVTSLCLRARRALARSYLVTSITQPATGPDCASVRELLPCYVLGDSAAATVARVEHHLAVCDSCDEAVVDMRFHAEGMRRMPWAVTLLAYIRGWLLRIVAPVTDLAGVAALGTMAVTVATVMAITAGDAAIESGRLTGPMPPTNNSSGVVDTAVANNPTAPSDTRLLAWFSELPSDALPGGAPSEQELADLDEPLPSPAVMPAIAPTSVHVVVDIPLAPPTSITLDRVNESVLDPTLTTLDGATTGITTTVEHTAAAVNQLGTTVTGSIEPVIDGVTEPLVGLPVGTLAAEAVNAAVAATTAAASATVDSTVNEVVVPAVGGVVSTVQTVIPPGEVPATPTASQQDATAQDGGPVGGLLDSLLGTPNR